MATSLNKRIDMLCLECDRLMAWGISKIPDKNLPLLIGIEGFSDKTKSIIEERLKGQRATTFPRKD